MTTNASAGLIAALKTSLANAGAGWTVKAVRETSETRLSDVNVTGSTSGSVAGSIVGGDGNVSGATIGSVSSSTTSSTTVVTSIALACASPALSLSYVSTVTDNVFTEGRIEIDGASLKSTDSALQATIMGKAAAFNAARDAALIVALTTPPVTVAEIPSGLLANIKTSLADSAAGWEVRSRTILPASGGAAGFDLVVSLSSVLLRVPVAGELMRAQMTYLATIDAAGAIIRARVLMNGAEWSTSDGALYAAVKAKADAFLAAQATNLTGALD